MNNDDHFYAVIMAGGGGTRLWPLSRRKTPKQMVNLLEDETLFQISVNRLKGLFTNDHILVVTIADQALELQKQAPWIPVENYLIEPFPKGTASVVGYAASFLQQKDPDAIMAILTADHFISNVREFQSLLKSAYLAASFDYLVTLGIQPTYPATGFGYIHRGEFIDEFNGISAYRVEKFKEKPDLELAHLFVKRGDHDWNSGMFIWKVDTIMKEFKFQMPALYEVLQNLQKAWKQNVIDSILAKEWGRIKAETIDYGIMENAKRVAVLPAARLGWNDVGSWESLFEVKNADKNGNIVIGAQHLSFDTNNSLVYSQSLKKLIVTVGLEDTIIIETDDAILVCARKSAQEVKTVVKYLTEKGLDHYL
jgi:mannose-1-phosphate guanylyltransferase